MVRPSRERAARFNPARVCSRLLGIIAGASVPPIPCLRVKRRRILTPQNQYRSIAYDADQPRPPPIYTLSLRRMSASRRVEVWRGSFRFEHICCRPFRLAVPYWFDHGSVSTPRSSVGSRAGAPVWPGGPDPYHVSSPLHVARNVRISRIARPHLLHAKAYGTYPAGATFGPSRRTR